jgi:hypothetical protein
MRIFITTYILLTLASWSALAAPQSESKRNNGNDNGHMNSSYPSLLGSHFATGPAQKPPLSSSMLMGRQLPEFGHRLQVDPSLSSNPPSRDSTEGCNSKADDKLNGQPPTPPTYLDLTPTSTSPHPAIAGRRLRGPMRWRSKNSPVTSERDNVHAPAPIPGPSVNDILANHIAQAATGGQKRSKNPLFSRDVD